MGSSASSFGISRHSLRLAGALLCMGCALLLSTCSPSPAVLQQVQQLGVLRVVTLNSPTTYYEGAEGPTGFEYDLTKALAERLGLQLEILLAESPAEALRMVKEGRAHLAAAGLSVAEARRSRLRVTQPVLSVVPELVYRSGNRKPASLDDLQGTLMVVAGSGNAERLLALKTSHPHLLWLETPQHETEELLRMVAEGEIDYAVANSDLIAINQRYYPKLRVAFPLAEPQDLAWAFPASVDDSLFDAASDFLHEIGGAELARVRDRYFGHIEQVDYLGAVALARHVESRLPRYRATFEAAAAANGLDWRLLAAIGYQESHWDPAAVSFTGVRGLMQITLDTAAFLKIGDREDPVQSIHGGARYIRQLIDAQPVEIREPERTWLALAGYNLGLGHLIDAQKLTAELGGDPHRWLDVSNSLPLLTQRRWYSKTTHGYARGYEALSYVGNIRTYYDMLVWLSGSPAIETPELTREETPLLVDQAPYERRLDPLDLSSPVL